MVSGPFTIALVLVTVLISLAAFSNEHLMNRLILWPGRMGRGGGEYYRLLSSGFIHLDTAHLVVNMFTLYFMGSVVEAEFRASGISEWVYVMLYLTGIVAASLPSFYKHRHNSYYRSLGASGGVAAVIFSSIYFQPWSPLYLFGVVKLYSVIFAVLYLALSAYMARRGSDNVNHDAHFWGAVYGLVFTCIVEPTHGQRFLEEIQNVPF